MLNKPSPRQVVSKGRYVQVMSEKFGLASTYVCSFFLALFALFGSMVSIVLAFDPQSRGIQAFLLVSAVFAASFSFGAFAWTLSLIEKEQGIAAVLPLTKRNAHLMQPQETLVRSSEQPSAESQTELLRADRSGNQTPAEELLRPTQANGRRP